MPDAFLPIPDAIEIRGTQLAIRSVRDQDGTRIGAAVILDRIAVSSYANAPTKVEQIAPVSIDVASCMGCTYVTADGRSFLGADFAAEVEAIIDAHKGGIA